MNIYYISTIIYINHMPYTLTTERAVHGQQYARHLYSLRATVNEVAVEYIPIYMYMYNIYMCVCI